MKQYCSSASSPYLFLYLYVCERKSFSSPWKTEVVVVVDNLLSPTSCVVITAHLKAKGENSTYIHLKEELPPTPLMARGVNKSVKGSAIDRWIG